MFGNWLYCDLSVPISIINPRLLLFYHKAIIVLY